MKRADHKSVCPINYSLEVFGDTWSLLIVRDIAALGKRTYGEFLASDERIGTSVLAERLTHLEQKGIIAKVPDTDDKRKSIYSLTPVGMSVLPLLYEHVLWGVPACSDPNDPDPWANSTKYERAEVLKLWREAIEAGSSFMVGPHSVAAKLNLF